MFFTLFFVSSELVTRFSRFALNDHVSMIIIKIHCEFGARVQDVPCPVGARVVDVHCQVGARVVDMLSEVEARVRDMHHEV